MAKSVVLLNQARLTGTFLFSAYPIVLWSDSTGLTHDKTKCGVDYFLKKIRTKKWTFAWINFVIKQRNELQSGERESCLTQPWKQLGQICIERESGPNYRLTNESADCGGETKWPVLACQLWWGKNKLLHKHRGLFILIRHSHYTASMKVVTSQGAANRDRNYNARLQNCSTIWDGFCKLLTGL